MGVVVMDGKAKVVGLARNHGNVALTTGEFACEGDDPFAVLLLTLGIHQSLAAVHDPFVGNVTVVLGALGGPLQQVVVFSGSQATVFHVLGFLVVLAFWHGARVYVAGFPA